MRVERLALVAVATLGLVVLAACGGDEATMSAPTGTAGQLPTQRFAAHYVDSAPVHGTAYSVVPDKVLINFDFTLTPPSTITVAKDGVAVQTGATSITGANRLSLTAPLPRDGGDGLCVVTYRACWPDRSCHDGQFAFRVDSKLTGTYGDMTGKAEVKVGMKDIKFSPARIVVSQGTKVVWTNNEAVPHFVNTDPHPSHNNLPGLNSLDLREGQSYTFTFVQAGEWAYHCSAHYPQGMVGSVLVR